MADPLSIAASVTGLVTITAQIASLAKSLYTGIKDAPESVNKIEQEMDDMHLIFCEVQLFFAGARKRSQNDRNHLTMISLHHLMATLSGCVLVCTNLDKKISKVAGIRSTGTASSSTQAGQSGYIRERVKWALWKEAEATEIIVDLQRHKLSLNLMLSIIQCKNAADASDNLAQLHEVVSQILDSNRDISCQLRELIKRQDAAAGIISEDGNCSGSSGSTSTSTGGYDPMSLSPSALISNCSAGARDSDTASIRTNSSIRSTFSVRSFTQELKNSRAYKRLELGYSRRSKSTSQSTFSLDSSITKGDTWSMLSDMSLGGLSISEIAVLDLPVSKSDLHDPVPFQSTHLPTRQKQSLVKVSWASRGRLHNAVSNDNPFLVRTLLNLGADIEEVYEGRTPLLTLCLCPHQKNALIICTVLLDWGADIKSTDFTGRAIWSYAVENGYDSREICGLLLGRGADINSTDSTGRTPLSYAVANKYYSTGICGFFLDRGADINTTDSTGRTPLSYAVANKYNSRKICGLLLDRGADINSTDSTGRTPLSYAVENEYYNPTETCRLLLDRGADINSTDSTGRTPLSYAVENQYYNPTETCRLLLDRGTDINSTDSTGRTPLSYAVENEYYNPTETCRLLLDRGADINSTDSIGRTPLSYAVANKYYSRICRLLLDRGADINSTDSIGRTPLSYAVANKYYSRGICRLLLDRGADINSTDSTGRTPLSYAVANRYNSRETCGLLLDRGSDINSTDSTGRTPLSYAVTNKYNSSEICQLLLDRGADINSSDSIGRTSLSYAVANKYYSRGICRLLLDRGADINSTDSTGRTPLSYAVANEYYSRKICGLLLDRGADINSTDSTGRTPLSYAVADKYNSSEICQLLLDRGADINSTDSTGRTPLSYAAGAIREDGRATVIICKIILRKSRLDDILSPDSTGCTPLMYAAKNQEIVDLINSRIRKLKSTRSTAS